MRLRFRQYLRHLTLSLALLGTAGVLAGAASVASTVGIPLGTSTACGCEAAKPTACKEKKEKWVYCNSENKAIKEEKVEGTGGESSIKTAAITIDCNSSALGTIYIIFVPISSALSTATCKVATPAHCSIPSSFEGNVSGTLIGAVPGGPPEEELTGEGKEEEIMSVEITGSECSVKGTHVLTGKQTCKYDSTYETAQETHEVKCTGAGSKLKFGGEAAEFERTIKDHLASKGNWSIQLN